MVAVCEDKLVIVTDSKHVSIYSKDFKIKHKFFKMRGHRPIPRGVATNGEHIFIADKATRRIMKYTMDGVVVCESKEEFKGCFGMAIYEEKLYVPIAQGKIQVLDLDLNHLSSICEGLNAPRDVAIASNGTVYVSEYNNNCIKVFKGEIEEFSRNEVEHPTIICIYNQEDEEYIILVASHCQRCVFVFTPSGRLVKSIGEEMIGEVRDLYGLCIDKDGNVYIADYGGGFVKKFNLPNYLCQLDTLTVM